MYANLVYATPGLKDSQILDYFKDGSFGVEPANVERTETPELRDRRSRRRPNSAHCDDVTIVRDQFGVPHIYGQDRAALMFGIGYATGEDRLFLADALRHAGRADLSSFAGGANVGQDHDTFANAPYTNDAELQAQYDRADELYGQEGVQIQKDVAELRRRDEPVDRRDAGSTRPKLDALYAATGHPDGPEPWKVTDVIATGALVAGIFGKGGGGELERRDRAAGRQAGARGKSRASCVWKDFRSADDPEAPPDRPQASASPTGAAARASRGASRCPIPGSVQSVPVVAAGRARRRAPERSRPGRRRCSPASTRSRPARTPCWSRREESESGHPLAVFGPQTGYFAPQLLMEEDIHAPGGPEGPAIDARGVSFIGTNLYVQLGRGRDYSWSATSSGQDIIDTFAVKLCEPDGERADAALAQLRVERRVPADGRARRTRTPGRRTSPTQTPPGSETLRTYRTKAGLVTATATIKGKPYAYTKLRATYKHEVDSAGSFADWNSPDVGPRRRSPGRRPATRTT